MDRAEIVSVDVEFKSPAGTFKKYVQTRDTSAIESEISEKIFAPGVGQVKDDEFELAEIVKPKAAK